MHLKEREQLEECDFEISEEQSRNLERLIKNLQAVLNQISSIVVLKWLHNSELVGSLLLQLSDPFDLESFHKRVRKHDGPTKDPSREELYNLRKKDRKILIRSLQLFNRMLGSSELTNILDHPGLEKLSDPNWKPDTSMLYTSELLEQSRKSSTSKTFDWTDLTKEIISSGWCYRNDADIFREYVSASKSLLKRMDLRETFLQAGGLKMLCYACRSNDLDTLRHAAISLSSFVACCEVKSQLEIEREHAIQWLFRLALHPDAVVQYYALLANAILTTNSKMLPPVVDSGSLELVRKFVTKYSPDYLVERLFPYVFSCSCKSYTLSKITDRMNGGVLCAGCYVKDQSNWSEIVQPALSSVITEARIIATYHLRVEAAIRNGAPFLDNQDVLNRLKSIASSLNEIESEQARYVLKTLDIAPPIRLSPRVSEWSVHDVQEWLVQSDLKEYAPKCLTNSVDGDMLLRLNETILERDFELSSPLARMRFLRKLDLLKIDADYTNIDTTGLSNWLWKATLGEFSNASTIAKETWKSRVLRMDPNRNLVKYTYNLLAAGVDMQILSLVANENLLEDCGITNAVHRKRIYSSILFEATKRRQMIELQQKNPGITLMPPTKNKYDVFLSYRRSNGSSLASLLYTHLTLERFAVFLDVKDLNSGKFEIELYNTVRSAKHFVLVLSPNALDRCKDDEKKNDWIHKEISWALEFNLNIVPVMESFVWPSKENMPEAIQKLQDYNAIQWCHDYQDECLKKLFKFLGK